MAVSPKLIILLAVATISFVLLIIIFFSEVKDDHTTTTTHHNDNDDDKNSNQQSNSILKRRPLKPVPPLAKSEENNNNNNPIKEFFAPALSSHPLDNCPHDVAFSKNDLIEHNTADDLWITVYGYVLNVTSFVHHHPGGVNMIMKGAAQMVHDAKSGVSSVEVKDVADLFIQYHQPGTISLFNTFCIGRMKEDEVKVEW